MGLLRTADWYVTILLTISVLNDLLPHSVSYETSQEGRRGNLLTISPTPPKTMEQETHNKNQETEPRKAHSRANPARPPILAVVLLLPLPILPSPFLPPPFLPRGANKSFLPTLVSLKNARTIGVALLSQNQTRTDGARVSPLAQPPITLPHDQRQAGPFRAPSYEVEPGAGIAIPAHESTMFKLAACVLSFI